MVIDSNSSEEPGKKVEVTKPKRPEKYLTEKAYYMQQKLKSKQKTETRVLRRRLKPKYKKEEEKGPRKKEVHSSGQSLPMKRVMPIMKNSQK